MDKFIPLAKPSIGAEEITAVEKVLLSGMLVQGERVKEFEDAISTLIGVDQVMAVSNGTASLHLALVALGIGPGDEVIVPALSYVATANVVEVVGATPVFVDIEIDTFNINADLIEDAITERTKAIMPVHEFGLAADIKRIMAIAEKHGLFVIEDAACALGAKQDDQYVGSFGHFGSFSLHPRKAITSGEGGLLSTNDAGLADQIRRLRNHGVEIIDGKMEFVAAGLNYRLTDIQAALVNSQFKKFEENLGYKRKLAEAYFQSISSDAAVLPSVPDDRNHTWQSFHLLIDKSIDRDGLIADLRSKNIGTNYGAQCIPFMIYYQNKYALNCEELYPNALKAFKHGLAIPLHEHVSLEDISYISEQLNSIK